MPGAIIEFLFPSFPATFRSDYPLDVSVARLERVVATPSLLPRFFRPIIVCQIDEGEVRLHQLGWGGKGRYPMAFSGRFQETATGVVLSGRFSLRLGSRLWLGFALAFLAFSLLFSSVQAWSSHRGSSWWMPVCLLAVIIVSATIIRWDQRLFSNRRQLSESIAVALSAPPA